MKLAQQLRQNYEIMPLISFVGVAIGYGVYRIGNVMARDPDIRVKKNKDTYLQQ